MSNFKNMIVGANRDGFHLKMSIEVEILMLLARVILPSKRRDIGPNGRPLRSYRGIEVGHVFI